MRAFLLMSVSIPSHDMPDSLNLPATAGAVVLLAVVPDAGREALRATAETLEAFGLAWAEVTAADEAFAAAQRERGVRAVVVAAADGTLPGWWARSSGLPTVRVPVESGGKAGLALLRDDQGELPSAGEEGGAFATMAILSLIHI